MQKGLTLTLTLIKLLHYLHLGTYTRFLGTYTTYRQVPTLAT